MKSLDTLEALTDEYLATKNESEQVASRLSELSMTIMAVMERMGSTNVEGETGSVVLVKSVRLNTSEDRLKKALGAKLWDKVTKKVLDKKLLEACIVTGEVDPVVVADCSEESESRPYLRATFKKPATGPSKKSVDAIVKASAPRRQKRGVT